ncbi:MAG: hypothetical protein V1731_03300 [Candidatus Aenigmatarchaeota archaeon]
MVAMRYVNDLWTDLRGGVTNGNGVAYRTRLGFAYRETGNLLFRDLPPFPRNIPAGVGAVCESFAFSYLGPAGILLLALAIAEKDSQGFYPSYCNEPFQAERQNPEVSETKKN